MSDIIDNLIAARTRHPIQKPKSVRPLCQLMETVPPQDWHEWETFDQELELARKQFGREHPFGLRPAIRPAGAAALLSSLR